MVDMVWSCVVESWLEQKGRSCGYCF